MESAKRKWSTRLRWVRQKEIILEPSERFQLIVRCCCQMRKWVINSHNDTMYRLFNMKIKSCLTVNSLLDLETQFLRHFSSFWFSLPWYASSHNITFVWFYHYIKKTDCSWIQMESWHFQLRTGSILLSRCWWRENLWLCLTGYIQSGRGQLLDFSHFLFLTFPSAGLDI